MAKKIETGFNAKHINVVVEKLINGNLFQEVAEFVAEQDKSDSKSLVIKNDSVEFIEELDFSENELITALKSALDFKNKDKDSKINELNNKIEETLKNLKNIRDGYLKNEEKDDETPEEKINVIDEKVKLNLLQCLKQHVQDYDDKGAYEIINIRGMREIRFLVVDDLLYPLYRSPHNKTIYSNMVTKKKIYKVKADLEREELDRALSSKIGSFFKNIMPILQILLFCVLIFGIVNNYSAREKIDETIEERIETYEQRALKAESNCFEANTMCTFYLSKFTEGNTDLMNYASEQMRMLTQELNESVRQGILNKQTQRSKVINTIIDETK